MPRDLNFVGLVTPPEGAVETELSSLDVWFRTVLASFPTENVNGVNFDTQLDQYPTALDNLPGLMRRMEAIRTAQTMAFMPAAIGQLNSIREAIECVCEAIGQSGTRLQVVTEVLSRPVNISVQDGSPGPEIFAGGWVLFQDEAGNVGERSFIFTNKQRHVSDIPNAVGYTYHLMPGFDVAFT